MANLFFYNVGIKAISACVPKNVETIKSLEYMFSEADAENFFRKTGIYERRIATENICASDLCYEAAKNLLAENNISPDSIDVLLFMSQTGDYKIPATSVILQERLGLSKETACMDLNLACSGFVYALSTAYTYVSTAGVNRVLILTGETLSKVLNKNDNAEYPIFGDAGTAVLVERGDYGDSFFVLGSNGKGFSTINILDSIGGRNTVSLDSFEEKKYPDGIKRNGMQMYMDGMGVYSFTLKAVPDNIRSLLKILNNKNIDFSKIDLFLIHQANKLILDTLAKKIKIPYEKMPSNIEKYGNTSSASIPLILGTDYQEKSVSAKCLLSGFGAGLSYASAYICLLETKIGKLVEL